MEAYIKINEGRGGFILLYLTEIWTEDKYSFTRILIKSSTSDGRVSRYKKIFITVISGDINLENTSPHTYFDCHINWRGWLSASISLKLCFPYRDKAG